jgi:hypothetical protein
VQLMLLPIEHFLPPHHNRLPENSFFPIHINQI